MAMIPNELSVDMPLTDCGLLPRKEWLNDLLRRQTWMGMKFRVREVVSGPARGPF